MTIDIEKLIQDIDEDGSGEIELDEFRNLLSSSDWVKNVQKQTHYFGFTLYQYIGQYSLW